MMSRTICIRCWSLLKNQHNGFPLGKLVPLIHTSKLYVGINSVLTKSFSRLSRTDVRNVHNLIYDNSSAREFISTLDPDERKLLINEVRLLEEARLQLEGPDPPEVPSSIQLRMVALHSAIPFIGFGFLDNLLMIVFGEYIDAYLGVTLGISTMAAAGFGNLISDVAGIGSASYIENIAAKAGVHAPPLTTQQFSMKKTRRYSNFGRAFGVAFGCFLGMFPLLLFHSPENDEEEEKTVG